jgi:hypothetical protein
MSANFTKSVDLSDLVGQSDDVLADFIAQELAAHLNTLPGVRHAEKINPEFLPREPVTPRAAVQVELTPHRTFVVVVF